MRGTELEVQAPHMMMVIGAVKLRWQIFAVSNRSQLPDEGGRALGLDVPPAARSFSQLRIQFFELFFGLLPKQLLQLQLQLLYSCSYSFHKVVQVSRQ